MRVTIRPHSETSAFLAAFDRERGDLDTLPPERRTWMTDPHKAGHAIHCVIEPTDGIADVVRRVVEAWHVVQRMDKGEAKKQQGAA